MALAISSFERDHVAQSCLCVVFFLPAPRSGSPLRFIRRGIEGPKISASNNPTFLFMPAIANAKLTVLNQKKEKQSVMNYDRGGGVISQERETLPDVVDLPTPPFPEATAIMCLTPLMGIF